MDDLKESGNLSIIESEPYRLPYDDGTFDFVFSQQVFEHVQDYPEAIAEIHRILKVDGISLHVFPSRYRPIESHVFVPFASIIQDLWWLRLWARLGIRKGNQAGMEAEQVAQMNHEYLTSSTNYLTPTQILSHLSAAFDDYGFCEKQAAKYTRLGKFKWLLKFPFLHLLMKNYTRVMYMRRTR